MTAVAHTPNTASKPTMTLGILGGLSAGAAGLTYMIGTLGMHPAAMSMLPVFVIASFMPAVRLLQGAPQLRALYATTFVAVILSAALALVIAPLVAPTSALFMAAAVFVIGAVLTVVTYRRHVQLEN